jgi:SAM-dependent methyltransferase
MENEIVGRVRNACAQLLLELLHEPPEPRVDARFKLPFSSVTEADWRRAVHLWRAHAPELLASLPTRECPACAAQDSRWLFESYDAHPFHECLRCGCWFTPRVVEWSVFERLFAISSEAHQLASTMMSHRDEAVRDVDMARIGAYLDDLLPLVSGSNGQRVRYLDAGCGVGHSLRAGLDRGLAVQGVDVDDAAVAIARNAGLPVATPSEIRSMPPGPYDLLSFWETLEHIAHPLDALKQFLPFVADDGLVAITVPNLNAPAVRIMRESCPWVHGGYNTPGHLNLFHVPALEQLLSRAELTLVDVEGQYGGDSLELLAFLGGESRGIFDVLHASERTGALPAFLRPLMNNIAPGLALLEQYAVASPILRVVACRQNRREHFTALVAKRKQARREQMAETARYLLSFEIDYKSQLSELRTKWESSLSYKLERLWAKVCRSS